MTINDSRGGEVDFVAQGPDAEAALEVIREVFAGEVPSGLDAVLGGLSAASGKEILCWLFGVNQLQRGARDVLDRGK